jgi:hypothetical protein
MSVDISANLDSPEALAGLGRMKTLLVNTPYALRDAAIIAINDTALKTKNFGVRMLGNRYWAPTKDIKKKLIIFKCRDMDKPAVIRGEAGKLKPIPLSYFKMQKVPVMSRLGRRTAVKVAVLRANAPKFFYEYKDTFAYTSSLNNRQMIAEYFPIGVLRGPKMINYLKKEEGHGRLQEFATEHLKTSFRRGAYITLKRKGLIL